MFLSSVNNSQQKFKTKQNVLKH